MRGCRRRRGQLLGAFLAAVAVTGVVLSRWSPAGAGERVALPAHTTHGMLQFYGAARYLFSSESGSPVTTATASRPATGESEVPKPGPPVPVTSAAAGRPVTGDSELPEPGAPALRTFDRYDRELEPVAEGEQPPLTDDWLAERKLVYEQRLLTLRRACRRRHVGIAQKGVVRSILHNGSDNTVSDGDSDGSAPLENVKSRHFTLAPQLKTLTCLVNKAASTSILSTFLKLTGHGVPVFSSLSSPHSIAKVLQPTKPGQFELAKKQYFKFMLVRHPLERLVSAYEDKVVKADHPSLIYLRKSILATHEDIYIRQDIYRQLRASLTNETAVLAAYDAQVAAYRDEVSKRGGIPTFTEFLDFVLAKDPTGDGFDSHWTPYWRQCSPCHIDYDVIGKLETAQDDFKYIWHRMGIYSSVRIPRHNSLQRNTTTLDDTLRRYLPAVPTATIRRLRALFKLDFELFDYDWRHMLRLSGHCRPGVRCELD